MQEQRRDAVDGLPSLKPLDVVAAHLLEEPGLSGEARVSMLTTMDVAEGVSGPMNDE